MGCMCCKKDNNNQKNNIRKIFINLYLSPNFLQTENFCNNRIKSTKYNM